MNLNLFKIYFGVALSLLAAASAWGWSPMFKINEDDSFLIDDFEDEKAGETVNIVPNLGVWDAFTGDEYTLEYNRYIYYSKEKESNVLRFDYTFLDKDKQKNNHWEWIETRAYVTPKYTSLDFSSCNEIQFDYRAEFHDESTDDNWLDLRFRVVGDENKADVGTNYHFKALDVSDEWKTVVLRWSDLSQEAWDDNVWGIVLPVETVQKNLLAFSWFWHAENAATGTLELDNFRCINRPVYEVKFMVNDSLFYSEKYFKGVRAHQPPFVCTPENGSYCTDPTKEPSEKMMYTFKGWDKDFGYITEPTVFTALFDSTEIPTGKPLNITSDTLWLENFEDGDKVGLLGGPWDFFNSLKYNASSFESDGSEWSGIDLAVIFEGSFKESEDDVYLGFRLTDYPKEKVSFEYCFAFFGDEGVAIPDGWGDRQFADPTDIDFSDEDYLVPLCKNNETWHAEFEPSEKYDDPPRNSIRIKFNADGKAEGTEYMLLKVVKRDGLAVAQDMLADGIPFKIYDIDKMDVQDPTSSIVTASGNKILGIGNLTEPEDAYEWLGARLYLLKDSSAVDMSQCEAIQYRYKGEAHEFRVESAYEIGWQHYHANLPSSKDWTTAAIYWNHPEGFGSPDDGNLPLKQVGVIKKKVVALTWQKDGFYTDADGKGSIEIDDVRCIRNLPEVLVNFYSEGKKVGEFSVPYASYFRDVKIPNDPVKASENGKNYVFAGWTPEKYYDFELTKDLDLDALFVPTQKLEITGTILLIDDFDDGNMVSPLGGSWSISTKTESAKVSMAAEKHADGKCLKASFTNDDAFSYTRADIALNLQKDGVALDLSQCDAIQYDYRGDATHQFHLGTVFDNLEIERDYFETVWGDEEGVNWRTKTIYLKNDSLECHNGCKPVSEVKKAVYQLSWSFESYANLETFEIDNIKCIRTKFGAVTIAADNSTAIINGHFADNDVLDIPEDVVVGGVEFQRTFEVGKSATVMFPFSIEVSKVNGADFYSLAEMIYDKEEWKAGAMKVTGMLEANTPYLAIPTEAAITFKLEENEKITLNTTGSKVTKLGDWEFRGAYGRIAMADSAHLLGRAYGFAGEDRDGFKIGQFVKLGKGATVPATRTYLVKTESAQCREGAMCAPRASSVASAENLPDRIIVEFRDEEDKVMAVGTLNTKTGKIRLDRYHLDHWYDLRGHRLNGKPTAKGTYYNNGNMVIIK